MPITFYEKFANDEIRKTSRRLIFAKSPKICEIRKINLRDLYLKLNSLPKLTTHFENDYRIDLLAIHF